MKHLDEFTVVFTSAIARQVLEPGASAPKKYYRNNFTLDKKTYSVSNPDKLTGQVGKVRFVVAGEKTPTGTLVAQDAFSLIGAGTVAELREAVITASLSAELKDLI